MACARSESIFCWPRVFEDFFREERFLDEAVCVLLVVAVAEDLVVPDDVAEDFAVLATGFL